MSDDSVEDFIGMLTQRLMEWCPLEIRRKGRPRNSWTQEVTTEINNKEWIYREEWRRKINLNVQKDVKISILTL